MIQLAEANRAVGGKFQDLTFLAFFPCDDEEVVDEEEPGDSGFCRPTRNVIHGQIDVDGLAGMMWMGGGKIIAKKKSEGGRHGTR